MMGARQKEPKADWKIDQEIFNEWRRQYAPLNFGGEGYSPERDDGYVNGELARAAAALAYAASAMTNLNRQPTIFGLCIFGPTASARLGDRCALWLARERSVPMDCSSASTKR